MVREELKSQPEKSYIPSPKSHNDKATIQSEGNVDTIKSEYSDDDDDGDEEEGHDDDDEEEASAPQTSVKVEKEAPVRASTQANAPSETKMDAMQRKPGTTKRSTETNVKTAIAPKHQTAGKITQNPIRGSRSSNTTRTTSSESKAPPATQRPTIFTSKPGGQIRTKYGQTPKNIRKKVER